MVIGFDPPPVLGALWLLHHAFSACTQDFMEFQWDGEPDALAEPCALCARVECVLLW